MDLSLDEGLQILRPHLDALYMLPKNAWKRYQEIPSEFSAIFSKRTRASAMHDLMLSEAASYACKVDGIRWFTVNKLSGFIIDEKIAIRFKKLDSKIPTNQVISFRGQRNIPGIDVIHHLELGYHLDSLERGIAEICITYPSGLRDNFWYFNISKSGSVSIVENLFANKQTDTIHPSEIKPKKTVFPFRKDGTGGHDDDHSKW